MSLPTVTVVVPNYNHGKYLPAALKALFSQSVPPTDVVVIDDASTDNSWEVLDGLARQYPGVRVFRNEKNRGVNFTLNRGIELARGEYVLLSAADDEVMPGIFEKSLRLLAEHPGVGLSCGISEWREKFSGLTWHMPPKLADRPSHFSPDEMIGLGRQRKLYIICSNALMRTDRLREMGGLVEELRWHADWFANYVIGFRYGICFVPEILSVANLLEQSYFQKGSKGEEHQRVLLKLLELLNSPEYADVMPRIRAAGELALFGTPMWNLLRSRPEFRHFINLTLRRKMLLRRTEMWVKRNLPGWLKNLGLKWFYRHSPRLAAG